MADKKKLKFKDTFLGDLIGADGKIGVQGKGLGASLRGERRKADPAPAPTKAKVKASTNAKSKLAPSTSPRPKPRPESNTKLNRLTRSLTAVAKGSDTASKRFEAENTANRSRAKASADNAKREANLKAKLAEIGAAETIARLQKAADDSMDLAVKKAATLTRASKMTPVEAARRKDAITKYKQDKKDATKKTAYQLAGVAGVALLGAGGVSHDIITGELAKVGNNSNAAKVVVANNNAAITAAKNVATTKAELARIEAIQNKIKANPTTYKLTPAEVKFIDGLNIQGAKPEAKPKAKPKLGRGGGFGVYNINDPLNEGIDENLGKPKAFSRGGYSSKKKK
jgi:hypothetical protein